MTHEEVLAASNESFAEAQTNIPDLATLLPAELMLFQSGFDAGFLRGALWRSSKMTELLLDTLDRVP